jgi:hypothetical protein
MLVNNGGATMKPNSRSHTNLIKSPGDAPVGQWVLDPALPGLFQYPYAVGRRLSKVVVPKGTIVGLSGATVKDYLTGKYRNTITIAGAAGVTPIGVAPYNYFQRFTKDSPEGPETWKDIIAHDQFGADDFQPAIITREYVEVPYIPNPTDIYTYSADATPVINGMKFNWGAATNPTTAIVGTTNALKAGDFVKAGTYGKFLKWISGTDDASLIIGQCLELDTDMPPLGWLQYIEQVYEGRMSNREPFTPEPAPADGSPVYDPDYTYPFTTDYMRPNAPGAWKTIGNGQPGLTDGALIQQTTRIQRWTVGTTATTQTFDLDPVAKVDDTSITVKVNGVAVPRIQATPAAPYYVFNETTQRITVTLSASANGQPVEITYKVDPKSLVGVPASWDYVGSVGVARILLKF